jgi:hypothetical protein
VKKYAPPAPKKDSVGQSGGSPFGVQPRGAASETVKKYTPPVAKDSGGQSGGSPSSRGKGDTKAKTNGNDQLGADIQGAVGQVDNIQPQVSTQPSNDSSNKRPGVVDTAGPSKGLFGFGKASKPDQQTKLQQEEFKGANANDKSRGSATFNKNDRAVALGNGVKDAADNDSPEGIFGMGKTLLSKLMTKKEESSDKSKEVKSRASVPIQTNEKSTFNVPNEAMNATESIKSAVVGFLAGGIAVSPITYLHNFQIPGEIITNQLSQFEFDTLTGAISGAAFAMLYRYFVQEEKDETLVS